MPGTPPPADPHAIVFEVTDPEGREVGLNEGGWYHIQQGHTGLTPEAIREAICQPDVILENDSNDSINYAVFVAARRFFRVVCVKRWPDRSPPYQVSTAYSRSVPPRGRKIWQKPLTP